MLATERILKKNYSFSGESGYLDLLKLIVDSGEVRTDRTEVGTKAFFGCQMRFNLREGFPLLTTKKVNFKAIIHELL